MLQASRRFQTFEIVMRDKPAELLALFLKGTVLVLHLTDGGVLGESPDIMQWVPGACDPEGWRSHVQSDDNLALLCTNDGEFKHQLDRYKYPNRYPQEATPREMARVRATETLLMPLESHLLDQRYLGGPTPCATDLAIFSFVRQSATVESGWFARQPLPVIQAWLAKWFTGHLFEVCMTKQPVQAAVVSPEYQHPDGPTDQLTD